MIIQQSDIKTFVLNKEDKVHLTKVHVPTNVFFEYVKATISETEEKFMGFRVARYITTGQIVEEQKFNGKKDSSFFKAKDYFELLIEQNTPKEDKQNQQEENDSVGTFQFDKTTSFGLIKLDDPRFEGVAISSQDIDKVFSPPQTKKYGRLDMTVLEDPIYDIVRSKFALRYNKQASETIAGIRDVDLSEMWVYDMIPYSNGSEQDPSEETPPQDVNENSLSLNDIEKEEPEQREPKNPQEQQAQNNQEQQERDEATQPKPSQEKDEDLGWDDDEESEKDKTKKEPNPLNPNEKKGDKQENSDNSDEQQAEPNPISEEPEEGEPSGTTVGYNMDLIEAINKEYNTDDFLSQTKNLTNFMKTFNLLADSTLQKFAPSLGITKDKYNRTDFLNKLKQAVTPFFEKI